MLAAVDSVAQASGLPRDKPEACPTRSGSKSYHSFLKTRCLHPIWDLMRHVSPNSLRRWNRVHTGWAIGLVAASVPLRRLTWGADAGLHTELETVATVLALIVGAMALVRYYTAKSLSYLLLGTGFLGAALLDGFHAWISLEYCASCTPSDPQDLIAWSGVSSPIFLSLLMCARLLASKAEWVHPEGNRIRDQRIYLGVGALIVAIFAIFLSVRLPRPTGRPSWLRDSSLASRRQAP